MEKECLQLADCLKSLSPKLHINIKPRGFDDNFLRTLCKTKQQKEQLEAFLAKDSTFTNCSTCNTVLEDKPFFATDWHINFVEHTFTLKSISVCCKLCYHLKDVSYQILRPDTQAIQHFCKVNEIEPILNNEENTNNSGNEDVSKYQEAYSIAYSLQLFASNIPHLKVLDNHDKEFNNDTNIANLINELLPQSKVKKIENKKTTVQGKFNNKNIQLAKRNQKFVNNNKNSNKKRKIE